MTRKNQCDARLHHRRLLGMELLESRRLLAIMDVGDNDGWLGNNSRATAQGLNANPDGWAITGGITEGDIDFYRFDATSGGRVSASIEAIESTVTPWRSSLFGLANAATRVDQSRFGDSDSDSAGDSFNFDRFHPVTPDPLEVTSIGDSVFAQAYSSVETGSAQQTSLATVSADWETPNKGSVTFDLATTGTSSGQLYSHSFEGGGRGIYSYTFRSEVPGEVQLRPSVSVTSDWNEAWLSLSEEGRFEAGLHSIDMNAGAWTFNDGTSAVNGTVSWEIILDQLAPNMGLFAPDGTLVATGHTIQDFEITETGKWTLAVTNVNDSGFIGARGANNTGKYEAIVSVSDVQADISAKSITWLHPDVGGGISFKYTVIGSSLSQPASISFFWANSPDSTTGIQATGDRQTERSKGDHNVVIGGSKFQPPPTLQSHLIARIRTNSPGADDPANNMVSERIYASVTLQLNAGVEDSLTSSIYKGEFYTVTCAVTNSSSVPLPSLSLKWIEIASIGANPSIPPISTIPTETGLQIPALGFRAHTDISLGEFRHNWQWIPDSNPVLGDMFGKLTEVETAISILQDAAKNLGTISKLQGKILGWAGVMSDTVSAFLQSYHDIETSQTYQYRVRSDEALVLQGDFVTDVHLTVAPVRQVAYGTYHALSIGGAMAITSGIAEVVWAATFGGKLAPQLMLPGLFDISAGIIGILGAHSYYELAKDPPDMRYQETVDPVPMSMPSASLLTGVWRDALNVKLHILALQQAELAARNKADGAYLDRNPEWESRQLLAASEFAMRAASLQTKWIAYEALLNSAGRGLFDNQSMGTSAYIRQNGLPATAVGIFEQAGWSDEQIDNLTKHVAHLSDLPPDSRLLGEAVSRVVPVLDSQLALDQLERGMTLRTHVLGYPEHSIDEEELNTLDRMKVELAELIEQRVPSPDLYTQIDIYLARVRAVSVETSDTRVLEHLEDGLSYLLQAQHLDPSVMALTGEVQQAQINGKITGSRAEELTSVLLLAEQYAEDARFEEMSGALRNFITIVADGTGVSIELETAKRLISLTRYIDSFASRSDVGLVRVDVQMANGTINLLSNGVFSLVLLGTDAFNIREVNIASIQFAGASVYLSSYEDVNSDGHLDLVLQFKRQETTLLDQYMAILAEVDLTPDGQLGSNVSTRELVIALLEGQTSDGERFEWLTELDLFLSGKGLRELLLRMGGEGSI